MNYYQFHIGDYRSATMHLTDEEDLTYRRLLDMYYDSEQPIPKETQWVSRRLRVGCEVVNRVLQDFFVECENGWKHLRCDMEIAGYRDIVARNQRNGKLGGRPRKTQLVPSGNPVVTLTSNQEPVTINHKKDIAPKSATRFTPPSQEDVKNYCEERQRGVDYEKWFNFYSAKGWKVGKNKMVDWRAAVRTWEEKKPESQVRQEDQKCKGCQYLPNCAPAKTEGSRACANYS
jgi:uncharacterized protein YdaU (DUF1376 family)